MRTEQIKSEDGFASLSVDLEALRGQVAAIIGAADYKEEITGEYAKVQIVDLAAHLDASGGTSLSVKQDADIVGDLSVATDKFTVAAASGNTEIAGTLDVAGESTLASATISDITAQHVMFAGTAGAVEGAAGLRWDGSDLIAASAKVSDLTAGRVTFAGISGALVDSEDMTYSAGVLTVSGSTFGENVVIAGDLTVNGTTTTVNSTTVSIDDKSFVLAAGVADDASANNAGIYVGADDGGAGELASVKWHNGQSRWLVSEQLYAPVLQSAVASALFLKSDVDGDIVAGSAADLGAAVYAQLSEGTGVHLSEAAGEITIAIGQAVETTSDVTFDSATLNDLSAEAGKAIKVGASGLITHAAWNEFVSIEANVGLELVQDGFKAQIGLAQDIRATATPQFARVLLDNADYYVDSSADGLVLHASPAGDSIVFEYDGGKSISLGTAALDVSFAATTIMGAINELKVSSNAAASHKAVYTAGSVQNSGTAIFSVPAGSGLNKPAWFPLLSADNMMVFVNGMLMNAGTDMTFTAGASGSLSFTFNLQQGDVVTLQQA
jgi:hypothetical protein